MRNKLCYIYKGRIQNFDGKGRDILQKQKFSTGMDSSNSRMHCWRDMVLVDEGIFQFRNSLNCLQ
jgi:hypothetical protein